MKTEQQLIAEAEAKGWKLLKWKDRKGNDCEGWRSPDGKQCSMPPQELQDFYETNPDRN